MIGFRQSRDPQAFNGHTEATNSYMKVLAIAALIAVFPSPGATVTYAVHGTDPRGSFDATIALRGVDTNSVTVTMAGKTPVNVSLNGRPAPLDQSIRPAVQALEVTNAIVVAAQKGEKTVRLPGPPDRAPTLSLSGSGNTIHASGTFELPAPPQGDGPPGGGGQGGPPGGGQGGPPQGGARPRVHLDVQVTLANGSVTKAVGVMSPEGGGRGPSSNWALTRQP